jgi:hypothetical protein
MSNMLFEPIALNDVLVEPLLQLLSGEVIVAGACSMVLGVRSVWQYNQRAGVELNVEPMHHAD